MTRSRTTWRASLAVTAVSALALGVASPALASGDNASDPEFTAGATDVVGVGSDTSQIVVDFLAEGHDGLKGYNDGLTSKRIASFAADGTPASISLRGGTAITRPNGSGAGKALLYGAGNNADVSFARSSSGPSAAEVTGGLQFFPFAVDGLKIAVKAAGSNAPATIPVTDLVKIYKGEITTWNQITGNAAGSTATIHPLIPQNGSGTRSYFLSLLQAANGGIALSTTVAASTQEHSDADIKNDPDALAPFSTARAKGDTATIKTIGGLDATRPLYNVVRGADATKADFLGIFGKSGFICSAQGRELIEAAGFDQLAAQNRGGVCGIPTQSSTTNLRTAKQADGTQVTTTSLDVLGTPSGKVSLSATVGPNGAGGSVEFFEVGGTEAAPTYTKVGDTTSVSGGAADISITGVAAGQHTYEARYTPTDVDAYGPSTSAAATATVADAKYDGAIAVTNPTTTWGVTKTVGVTVTKSGVKGTGTASFVWADKASVDATLDANGKAAFALPLTTAPGTYWGVVSYSGDANFEKSFQLVKLVVNKATTKTSFTIPSKVKVKKSTKASVTVVINGTTQKANGTVTLKIGSTTVGSAKVVNGKATVTVKAQTKTGKKSVKAYFTPSSSSYGSSTSSTVSYTVVK